MGWLRPRSDEKRLRESLEPVARAQWALAKLMEDFLPFAPSERVAALREPLTLLDLDEYAERLARHDELFGRASRGDGDAALEFWSAARRELVAMLNEAGHDPSPFQIYHPLYGRSES